MCDNQKVILSLQLCKSARCHRNTMKVCIRQEKSQIHNDDIKWYLSDESLWITKYDNYADIEKSIENSYGSFNWLYDVNDTLLFEKGSGKFNIAIISLLRKINVSENTAKKIIPEVKGDLYLIEKEHCNFEFDDLVNYVCVRDYLYSYSEKCTCNETAIELSITTDFSFFISKNSLVGWGLKNASKHLKITSECIDEKNEYATDWLMEYFTALKRWEEDENKTVALVKLLEKVQKHNDTTSSAIKESLNNILSF